MLWSKFLLPRQVTAGWDLPCKTYFFPKCWKVKEKTLLTYPTWKKLYESSCFHNSNCSWVYRPGLKMKQVKILPNSIWGQVLWIWLRSLVNAGHLLKRNQLRTVSRRSVVLQVPQGYKSSLTLASLKQQLHLLPSNERNGRRNSHIQWGDSSRRNYVYGSITGNT